MNALFLWLVSIGASPPLLVPGGFTDPAVAVHYNDNIAESFGDTAADLDTKLLLASSGTHQLQMWLTEFPIHTFTGSTALLDNDQSTPATTTIYVKVTAGNDVTLYWGDGTSVALTADGALHVYTHDYSAGTYTIAVGGDTDGITDWRSYLQTFLSGSIGRFGALSGLAQLYLYNTKVSGDIGGLGGLTSLTMLQLQGSLVSGDIGGLGSLTSMTQLYVYSTPVSGDIGDLSGLTGLTILYLSSTSVSGDIGDLSSLTSLTQLYLNKTSVSGNIGGLGSLTGLTILYLNTTSVSGDIGNLSSLTSLVLLSLYTTSLSYGSISPLPPWAGANLQVQSTGLDSTEVDDFLIDLASGVGANGTLNIGGSNAARTSASDAAKATLLAAGWSVTVNE